MEPQIYFVKESPDFNFMIEKGRIERIAANRVVMCIMTEFGLCNDRRMGVHEFSRFIESTQITIANIVQKRYTSIGKGVSIGKFPSLQSEEVSIECV